MSGLLGELQQPSHRDTITRKLAALQQAGQGSWLEDLERTWQDVSTQLRPPTPPPGGTEPVRVRVETSPYWYFLESAVPSTPEFLIHAFPVILLTVFMLIQREDLRNRILRLWPRGRLMTMTRVLDDVSRRISRFLARQLLVNACYAVIFGVGLWIIGVPYALLWAFLTALLRYI